MYTELFFAVWRFVVRGVFLWTREELQSDGADCVNFALGVRLQITTEVCVPSSLVFGELRDTGVASAFQ